MIERYSRPKMSALWSEEAKYRTWLDIEILACEAWAKLGQVPEAALKEIHDKANFSTENILKREEKTKHDVAAFVSEVQSHCGDSGKYIHYGLTSSDVLDTALAYRLTKSADILLEDLDECLAVTKRRAVEDKEVPMIGRTHGIHAEPTTMGLKWLSWHAMLARSKRRLETAKKEISFGKISGSVGNYANTPPEVEEYICGKLGLRSEPISTQVIPRDRHASYFTAIGILGSVIETIAVELRHLQRTELSEVREGFTKGQKGSSSMPHKRNPISAENLTGGGRMLRSMALPAMENCALWHERDISHSSVERMIGPDANVLADYLLGRLAGLLDRLEVFPDRMLHNLNQLQGVVYSQQVLSKLIESGLSRDEAYEIVQKNALQALDQGVPFLGLLQQDERVTKKIAPETLSVLFQPQTYFKHLEHLYKKVLENGNGDE